MTLFFGMSISRTMKKIVIYFFSIFLILSFPSITYAKWGKGELKMDKDTMQHFLRYLYGGGSETMQLSKNKRSHPLVFTVAKDGKMSHYYYCPYVRGCVDDSLIQGKSEKKCEKNSNGVECYTFAIGKRVVWKNGEKKLKIKKSDLKNPFIVAKKIQEAGFYDGDISKLSGIDMDTGQIDKDISITGKDKTEVVEKEDKTEVVEKSSDSNSNIVDQLTKLKALLDSGAITNEEFDKAKKILLNK